MARDFYIETVTYVDAEGDAHPVSNVNVSIKKADGSLVQVYTDKTLGTAHANPFLTDSNAEVSFWADPGEYKIELVDLNSPKRFDDKVIWWMSLPFNFVDLIVPIGSIFLTGRNTPPTDWLICDGTAVSRTSYNALFLTIGTNFGIGDGSSTFNLPDLRGRVPIGKGEHADVASIGFVENPVVTVANRTPLHFHPMPHAHTLLNHTHSHSHTHSIIGGVAAHTHTVLDHAHGITTVAGHNHTFKGGNYLINRDRYRANTAPGAESIYDRQATFMTGNPDDPTGTNVNQPMDNNGSHNHGGGTLGATAGTSGPTGASTTSQTTDASVVNTSVPSTDSTGGTGTPNTSPGGIPFQAVNYMIKYE